MKISKYIPLALLIFATSSCDSLLQEDLYSELDDNYANSPEGLQSLLTSAYGNAQLRNYEYFFTSGMTSGENWNEYGAIEANFTPLCNFTWDSNHPYFSGIWTRLYSVIRDVNIILQNADPANDAQLIAEAKFLRGISYYWLHDWFGRLPLYKSPDDDYYQSRVTEEETVAFIEQDLLEAAEILPVKQSVYGKATKGAAWSFLAKLYLNTKRWQECADLTNEIIELQEYSLFSDYTKLFLIENEGNAELIWTIQSTPQLGNPFVANTFPTDYPHLPNQTIYASQVYLFDDFVNSFAANDKRRELIITSYTNTNGVFVQLLGNNRSYPGKYEFDKDAIGASYGNDVPVLRYADVLISRAEALNELNGPNAESIALLNQVRQRALPELLQLGDFSKETLREQIFKERTWEFWYEQARRSDQVRQGTFIADANRRGKTAAKAHHILFPIPQTEIDANPNLEQNDGY
ncbi:RagB/SusD family nutrient uptake outer membrane protein [Sphingobacterium corticibacterium]|uniref:RagB/SusD family nutrient uptake outer membrane protein n=1 Tax=Sphingobacterium corticibacterium TaxID=2484746 RepID=A0A4Q6XPE9_9SPHI|nr:RagB/SusD family nutrient uptake outer membrane protein [Sphingobacterium corticibacterium]RZF58307.1 RagB/SusD family nutrient uptake outer membrane protein [Sphingobacterium corticibacterium]